MRISDFIIIFVVVGFGMWLVFSVNHPYIEPGWLNIACWFFLAPSLFLIFYVVCFSGKLRSFNRERYWQIFCENGRSQLKAKFYVYILPGFLALIIVYVIYLLPVIPTRLYANHPFVEEVKVIHISCNGHIDFSTRSSTQIRYFDNNTNEIHSLWYWTNLCRKIPNFYDMEGKTVKLIGKNWVLGTYVDDIYY